MSNDAVSTIWNEITIYTTTAGIDIVGGFLTEHGIRGHIIEDANDFNAFLEDTTVHWDYIEDSLMALKDKESNVKFYLPDNAQGIETFNQIRLSLEGLRTQNASVDLGRLAIETANVDEEDWSTAWKKYYHPTKVGEHITVVPCWEEYCPQPDEVVVTLDPGMAFGTGTHETTRLCMQLLERYITKGTALLDVGTGSGILAITALLLGASAATGVDIDELSCKVAQENADLNHVGEAIELIWGDLTQKVSGTFDVITANIVADVIIRLSKDVKQFMRSDSVLIVSGIIDERGDEVLSVLDDAGLSLVERIEENGWVAAVVKLKQ